MRVFSSWRFAGSVSLLSTAVLLWLGTFLLSWPASGSEFSAVLTIVGVPHAEQGANGHPLDGKYPAMLAEEDEGSDQLPKNAMLLRTLVLVLFFGPALGWLLASCWRGSRPEDTSLMRCCFPSIIHLHQRRAVASLLGVFRL
jgi:phosphate/sulfate permease